MSHVLLSRKVSLLLVRFDSLMHAHTTPEHLYGPKLVILSRNASDYLAGLTAIVREACNILRNQETSSSSLERKHNNDALVT